MLKLGSKRVLNYCGPGVLESRSHFCDIEKYVLHGEGKEVSDEIGEH